MGEKEYTEIEQRFEVFCKAWGVESSSLLVSQKAFYVQAYYLDILCGFMANICKPAPIIFPKPPGSV